MMVYSLALDTSQSQGQMLLLKEDKVLYFLSWDKEGSHSELITLKFQELCDLASIGVQDITKIYCVCGPGSFTGCRVAVAFARALACSLDCVLTSINSLDLLSLNCFIETRPVLACIDAQRNSVFASFYKKDGNLFKNKLLSVESLDEFIKEEVSLCGEGLDRYKNFINPSVKKYLKQDPRWIKADLRKYFEKPHFRKFEKEISWMNLKPVYIKASAAEEKRKQSILEKSE